MPRIIKIPVEGGGELDAEDVDFSVRESRPLIIETEDGATLHIRPVVVSVAKLKTDPGQPIQYLVQAFNHITQTTDVIELEEANDANDGEF